MNIIQHVIPQRRKRQMNNIKKIRKEQGISITELAKSIGMSQSNLTKIENNQLPLKDDTLTKIAQKLNVSKEILSTTENTTNNCIMIPIINYADMNLPNLSLFPISTHLFNHNSANLCVFLSNDDGMIPTITNKAAVVINKEKQSFNKNGIYLLKINNKLTLRRLQEAENNTIHIIPDNKLYIYQTAQINDIEIVGQAIFTLNTNQL